MDEAELFAKRASSFGYQAGAYAEHRPDYPISAILWTVGGATRPVRRVLDLAAGTGKLTGVLVTLGFEVTAVEPDPDMLAELSKRFPTVTALTGRAERIPLPDGAVDAVLAGQAFHWFDPEPALAEIARVLRPGGVVGALWNVEDDRVDWVAELVRLSRTSVSRPRNLDDLLARPAFRTFEREQFPHSHRRTAESLTATLATHSHTVVIPDAERAAVLDRVRRYLESRPETGTGEFELPLLTVALRSADVALEHQS
jgi:SAM-dependent methyltransferase